jgi:hypothetical protein
LRQEPPTSAFTPEGRSECRSSHSGTFDQSLIDKAKAKDWAVVSMKNDWKRIFAFE